MTPSARPRLLLIHGLLGSLNYFEPQRYLPGVDVLGPDLIGYGQRRSEDGGITLHAQAALLARYLRDEAGGPARFSGSGARIQPDGLKQPVPEEETALSGLQAGLSGRDEASVDPGQARQAVTTSSP